MHHNLLLAWLAAFLNEVESRKKAANSKLWCINYTSYAFKNSVLT